MSIRVLSVIHFPIFGGPMNRNGLVAKELESEGVDTTIVIPNEPGNAIARFHEMGIDAIQIPLHRIRSSPDPRVHLKVLRSAISDIAGIRSIIRSCGIDVVLVNGSANPHGALAAAAENKPVVWQLLDTFPPRAFLSVMMPMILRMSDVLMTTGMTTAAFHPGAMTFDGPLVSFGPCIPVEKFAADASVKSAARHELGLSECALVVGNVNNLNPMKGHRTFLRAAATLKARQEVKFVLLGSSGYQEYVDSLVTYARSLGLVLGDDLIIRDAGSRVSSLAQAIDVFWLTSEPRSEGMSTALTEAQCLGIPAVATRAGAVHECIRHGETGFLVAPYDIEAIVAKTQMLLSDKRLYDEMARAASQHVRHNFSVEATSQRHLEAYQAALASTKTSG